MSLRGAARRAIDALGLRRPVFRIREALIARGDRRGGEVDGTPVPPPYLRTLVAGVPDLDHFIHSGRETVEEFDALLAAHGGGFAGAREILDLGCGCGRLARWVMERAPAARVTGADINPRLLKWSRDHLPGRWVRVRLGEPLPFAQDEFDLVYACSVLTHLREDTARAWLADVGRVLEPGGLALITFHDERHPSAAPVTEALDRDGWAVRFDAVEGSNNLASYVTAERLAAMLPETLDPLEVS